MNRRMTQEETTCCICLETATIKESIQLLGCGCKVAWFHQSCENNWITNTEYPYSCPTCRRNVPMFCNYSFSYELGPEQRLFWTAMILLSLESIICGLAFLAKVPIVECFPFQSASILLTPFIIPSNKTYQYYLYHTIMQIYSKFGLIVLFYNKDTYTSLLEIILIFSYTQIICVYLFNFLIFTKVEKINSLIPFAISSEIVHAALITKTTADTLERDKGALLLSPLTATALLSATTPNRRSLRLQERQRQRQ